MNSEHEQEQGAAEDQDGREPGEVSGAFVVSMFDDEETLIWPGCTDGAYYISARRASIAGDDKITNAGTRIQANTEAGRGKRVVIDSTMNPAATYMEKCLQQITDYRIPCQFEKGKEPKVRTYDSKDGGFNARNKEVYAHMADRRMRIPVELLTHGEMAYLGDDITRTHITMIELLDGFLDHVHGRDSDAQRDFEALGNGLLA